MSFNPEYVAYTYAMRNASDDPKGWAIAFSEWAVYGWQDHEHVDSAFDRFVALVNRGVTA